MSNCEYTGRKHTDHSLTQVKRQLGWPTEKPELVAGITGDSKVKVELFKIIQSIGKKVSRS